MTVALEPPVQAYGWVQVVACADAKGYGVLRLDYISCGLTVVSTILVGRKLWQGWIVAGANSAIICVIGARTAQFGFIPANLFCIVLYAYNFWTWRKR